ncbi:type VI secretion system tip protein VgrG [Providencia stuartii]|uniref:Rhs element Vgr protein n=4 Tax=Providencia stuartii TaxID=588 RepID=A0AA87CP42_PROST|nr:MULTISPECIES: type VI secretion system tip protein TssI/VgrG [Providencia]EDU57587.1 Rhs element Vgr protein [Providencia stuartii ATCC 25827]MBS7784829.1 type VI secretion system tip protein VgrG [Providencia thailandensis]MCR4081362.1 type VI secretion system tip protein VgrG [Providencia stuartii]MTC82652.1 type VI secretion system tip protein VgrG [Providencia stuartii]MTC95019.1 type VI secretion system tip protein VgrG [Providencia stuartii]
MSTQNSSKSANPPPVKMTPAGRAYAEQERRTAKRDSFLKAWYNGELNSGLVFNCRIDGLPDDTFQVTEFDLQEGLSELFTLTLHAVSSLLDVDFHDILGGASSLTVKRDGIKIREVQGLLASAENLNTDGVKTWYKFVIRPEMWVMTLKQDSRIFQDTTVPKILETLLNESHIKHDKLFYHPEEHLERPYITQKRETMYDFWCRLAAEEGITFWFEEGPKLFYSDRHLGMTAGITLTYNPQADTDTTDSTATTWRYAEQLCSDIRIDKDYNQQRPSHPLSHQVVGDVHHQHEVFESYGRFQEDAEGETFNQIRYEQSQNNRQMGHASTNCFALHPGKMFTLTNHPNERMNKRWQVVRVSHHGVQPLADNSGGEGTQLSNSVSFIPETQEWRPPYRYKPTADGDELATVVGPPGEEIYTNSKGEVVVYFHWDRRGTPDHGASCWVPVSHGWSGNGYGFMSIPHVGQQVLVSYLNGDIDRPIVTGCTYNGRNKPPLNLPNEKTRTTFKTCTHKGEGFNELRFEDKAGYEEIYFHAQRDMNVHIQNDNHTHIQRDSKQRIDQHRYAEIAGDDHLHVKGTQKALTEGDVFQQVLGAYHQQVDGALVSESGQETHLSSQGKVVIEAATEITLKVGGSFVRITPSNVFTSGNVAIGDSGGGSGQAVNLQLPDGVAPFAPPPYPIKPYCAMQAQATGSWVIKPNGGNA